MYLMLNLPTEFEEAFNTDRFQDELARLSSDIRSRQLSGYDWQFIDAMRQALNDADTVSRLNTSVGIIDQGFYISSSSPLQVVNASITLPNYSDVRFTLEGYVQPAYFPLGSVINQDYINHER